MKHIERDRMHLITTLIGVGWFGGAWRTPEYDPVGVEDITFFQRAAQTAERGKLDAVFVADSPVLSPGARYTPLTTPLDPVVLLTSIAAVTERIGLIATSSTTYNEPYTVARQFASLDHVSRGRVGWNIVATAAGAAGRNFGRTEPPDHGWKYERAAEFVDVACRLWDSLEPPVHLYDKESGEFLAWDRVRPIDHQGRHFTVAGPLNVLPCPQGRPVLVQAGASDAGVRFGAKVADVAFVNHTNLEQAQAFYRRHKAAVAEAGRDPADTRVLVGMVPVIGSTEHEARERLAQLEDLIHVPSALESLAGKLGIDKEWLALDEPLPVDRLPSAEKAGGSWSQHAGLIKYAISNKLTVRELIKEIGGRVTHRIVCGTPEQVADHAETWFRSPAADGFNVLADALPSGLEAFVEHVVPILQRRGLFREDYDGTTLRSHFGLPTPAPLAAVR